MSDDVSPGPSTSHFGAHRAPSNRGACPTAGRHAAAWPWPRTVLGLVLALAVAGGSWALAGALQAWAAATGALFAVLVVLLVDQRAVRAQTERLRQAEQRHQEDCRLVEQYLRSLVDLTRYYDNRLREVVAQAARGEGQVPTAAPPQPPASAGDSPWHVLEEALARSHQAACHAIVHAPQQELSQTLLYLAGGVHSLVVQAVGKVAQLEDSVDDQDALYEVFDVHHLLHRTLRRSARFAVLGGARARVLDEPVLLLHLLRNAAAEVERFAQVRIPIPELQVRFQGEVAADLIHLLAELAENATLCSSPQHNVEVRTQENNGSVLVEIVDRGTGMGPRELEYFNRVLAAPQLSDRTFLLRERQLGLLVVALLAKRYGVQVRLEHNFFRGITAQVRIPFDLLTDTLPSARDQDGTLTQAPQCGADREAVTVSAAAGPAPVPAGGSRRPTAEPQRSTAAQEAEPRPELPRRPAAQPRARAARPADAANPRQSATGHDHFLKNFFQGVARADQVPESDPQQPHPSPAPSTGFTPPTDSPSPLQ
ncbi:ATP-binding protein [Streptomyces spectabilis]|uniref:ATP-binding protein n=1 Tax=Streptomyces spectabilis TaxID=68270 RepID=UPI003403DBA5